MPRSIPSFLRTINALIPRRLGSAVEKNSRGLGARRQSCHATRRGRALSSEDGPGEVLEPICAIKHECNRDLLTDCVAISFVLLDLLNRARVR